MKRRQGSSPVTFFSFQDVLLSLIGVTIVITIILMLQVTQRTAERVTAARASVEAGLPIDERERILRDSIAVLEAAVRRAQERPDSDPLLARSSLRQELRAGAGDLEQLEKELAELKQQLNALLLGHPNASTLREVMELIRLRDERVAELEKLERNRRISYIVDDATKAQPVLFEISDRRIIISELGARHAPERIPAGTLDSAVRHAMRHYATITRSRNCYILIVLKPSGIPLYVKLLDAIYAMPAESRPKLGLDLIPEQSFVSEIFPGSAVGGSP